MQQRFKEARGTEITRPEGIQRSRWRGAGRTKQCSRDLETMSLKLGWVAGLQRTGWLRPGHSSKLRWSCQKQGNHCHRNRQGAGDTEGTLFRTPLWRYRTSTCGVSRLSDRVPRYLQIVCAVPSHPCTCRQSIPHLHTCKAEPRSSLRIASIYTFALTHSFNATTHSRHIQL